MKILLPSLALTGLVLAACASTPPAEPAIAAGSASLDAARSSGAAEFASVDLSRASLKLEQARAMAQAHNDVAARRLAEEADVDAQLARARAGSERSRRAAAEIDASLQSLRDEMNRAVAHPVTTTTTVVVPVPAPQ